MRRGVLVHAASVAPAVFERLVPWLTGDGPLSVGRAHADWTRLPAAPWLPVLRRHGIQLRHHFRTGSFHDPAMVAITVDALDLCVSSELEHLVLVGDVGSATPLVERLRERGVTVSAAAPARTPHDFRAACTDFLDLTGLVEDEVRWQAAGRHRAT